MPDETCYGCTALAFDDHRGGALKYEYRCALAKRGICFCKDPETFKATDVRPKWCPKPKPVAQEAAHDDARG